MKLLILRGRNKLKGDCVYVWGKVYINNYDLCLGS